MSLKEPPKRIHESSSKHSDPFFTPHALECMERAVTLAVADHHRVGNPVYIWGDGGIARLYPDGSTEPAEC